MRFVGVDGTSLHVVRDGDSGPVVLFTQGVGGAWFDWDPVVPLLAADHRLIRFDRPGLGWSQPELDDSGRPLPQTLEGEARRMARVLDALGIAADERVILVAHSYGAFHAEAFARLYPERTAGVVFVDPSVEPEITPKPGGPTRAVAQGIVEAGRFLGLNQFLGPAARRLVIATASYRRADPDPVLARAVYRSSRVVAATANELASYRAVAVELLELRCERAFPEVLVQVLVGAHGTESQRTAARWVERLHGFAGLFPGSEVVELPDAKHLIATDRPDAVATAVRSLGF